MRGVSDSFLVGSACCVYVCVWGGALDKPAVVFTLVRSVSSTAFKSAGSSFYGSVGERIQKDLGKGFWLFKKVFFLFVSLFLHFNWIHAR